MSTGTAGRILLDGSGGTQTIDYLDVKDSNANGGAALTCLIASEGCVNSGNNTNWNFGGASIVRGRLFDDVSGNALEGKIVAISVNGASTIDTDTTGSNGSFSLSGFTMTGGTLMAIYIDNETENGVTVSLGSGSNMTGVNLYQDHLTVRAYTGSLTGTINNIKLNYADNSNDADIAAVFSVDGASTLNVAANTSLFVWEGTNYEPGGEVNTHDLIIDGTLTASGYTLDIAGTLTIDGTLDATDGFNSSTITLSGSFINNGTFTAGGSHVVLEGSSQTIDGTTTFNDLTKVHTGGDTLSFGVGDTVTVNNILTLTGGADAGRLRLYSTVEGGRWYIDPAGLYSISNVVVRDSQNLDDQFINPEGSADNGNNIRWFSDNPVDDGDDDETESGRGNGNGGDDEIPIKDDDDETAMVIPIIIPGQNPETIGSPEIGTPIGIVGTQFITNRTKMLERLLGRLRKANRIREMVATITPSIPEAKPRVVVPPEWYPPRHATAPEGHPKIRLLVRIGLELLEGVPFGIRKLTSFAGTKLSSGIASTPLPTHIQLGTRMAIALVVQPLRHPLRALLAREDVRYFLQSIRGISPVPGIGNLAQRDTGSTYNVLTQRLRSFVTNLTGETVLEQSESTLYATRLSLGEDPKTYVVEELRIALRGPGGIPLANAPATLFSTPKKTISDAEGIAEFQNVETGEHELEVRVNDSFIIHRKVTLDAPDGLTIDPNVPVDVLLPIVNVVVEDIGHGAAPEELSSLRTQREILLVILGLMLCTLGILIHRRKKYEL